MTQLSVDLTLICGDQLFSGGTTLEHILKIEFLGPYNLDKDQSDGEPELEHVREFSTQT
jgi:hypothetical protein